MTGPLHSTRSSAVSSAGSRAHPTTSFMAAASAGAVLHWFRRGLRLHDNPALVRAVSTASEKQKALVNVYVFDPGAPGGTLRERFLYDSVRDLDRQLRERGSRLFVAVGSAVDVLPSLVKQFGAKSVVYEQETAAWARERDSKVCRLLRASGVNIVSVSGHTLYDPQVLVKANGGSTPTSMKSMQHVMSKLGHPEKPLPMVDSFPPFPHGVSADGGFPKGGELPSWESFGISMDGFNYRYHGGETVAVAQLSEFLNRAGGKVAANFEKPNTSPAEFEHGQQETTILSPHLALGTLSPRFMYYEVLQLQTRLKKVSQPPASLLGQLMFRELFHALMATIPNFANMAENPMCRQIKWDSDDDANTRWRRWEDAETGYPWIDALMNQLKTEGYMHHLGRHSVACFLTRGDLYVSWEKGQETFERYLIDWDEALNAGNWMWLSASAFFSAYYRVYSPVSFAKRWSAAPAFIRHYLPVLHKVPDKYIFEPWKMPTSVAHAAGVEIGKDYPRPMVDHGTISKANISRMAEAYRKSSCDSGLKDSSSAQASKKRSSATRGSSSRSSKSYKMSK